MGADGSLAVKNRAPSAVPSPAPSSFPSPIPGYPYDTVALPALAPNTQYMVNASIPAWGPTPPICIERYTQTLGTFTTGS